MSKLDGVSTMIDVSLVRVRSFLFLVRIPSLDMDIICKPELLCPDHALDFPRQSIATNNLGITIGLGESGQRDV